MKEIIDKAKREGNEVYCAFLDLEKAYDTVNRDIMWEIMRKKGFNKKIINILKSMYKETKAIFRLGYIET